MSLFQPIALKVGNFFFRYRNSLFPLTFILIVIFARPSLFMGNAKADFVLSTLGIVVALLGQALRLLVIGYAYIQRGGKDKKVYASELVVEGLYAHSRNPMYLANIMMAIGLCMLYNSLWLYLIVIPFFWLVYLSIVEAEETYLQGKFGAEYTEYCQRVPRFLLNLRGLKQSLSGYKYDWRKALRKEYGTLFATLAGLLAIVIWKIYLLSNRPSAIESIISISYLFIPLLVFYIMARGFKKTGMLGA